MELIDGMIMGLCLGNVIVFEVKLLRSYLIGGNYFVDFCHLGDLIILT